MINNHYKDNNNNYKDSNKNYRNRIRFTNSTNANKVPRYQ